MCSPCYSADANAPGASSCANPEACPAGNEYNRTIGECQACPSGRYSDGTRPCATCLRGSVPSQDQSACDACPAGYVTIGVGAAACTPCPEGTKRHSGKDGDNDENQCIFCPAGYAANAPIAATECVKCEVGTYRAFGQRPVTACRACPGGSTAARNASSSCTVCRAGSAPNAAATACVSCPTATYRPAFSTS